MLIIIIILLIIIAIYFNDGIISVDGQTQINPNVKRKVQCLIDRGEWNKNMDSCIVSTSDGGKVCSKASDCQGRCLTNSIKPDSSSGKCSQDHVTLGCQSFLDEKGENVFMCAD